MSEKDTALDETAEDGALVKFREIFHTKGFPKGVMGDCRSFLLTTEIIAKLKF